MDIKLKPKHFGPLRLDTSAPGVFTYTTKAGYSAAAGDGGSTEFATPSDLIMAALASCIAISLENAAKVARKAFDEGTSLRDACVSLGFLTAEGFDEVFKPEEMV